MHSSLTIISSLKVDTLNKELRLRSESFVIRREVAGEELIPIVMDLDSLSFCKSYEGTSKLSTGGYWMTISVSQGGKDLLIFKYDSSSPNDFDFRGFLTLYPTLQDNLPASLPGYSMFDDLFLMQVIDNYFETIQCEDFYYQEFIGDHPERTPRQNRTREGWDFEKYLGTRSGS